MNAYRVTLASCLLVWLAGLSVAADKPPIFRIESAKVHIARSGSGWMEVTAVASADLFPKDKEKEIDLLSGSGATNRKNVVTKVDDRTLQIVSRGDLKDILDLVRAIDSSNPYGLVHRKPFEIRWTGKVFRLELKYEYDDDNNVATNEPQLEITTDGQFTKNTSGKLSDDRSKTTLKGEGNHLILEIEGLGVK